MAPTHGTDHYRPLDGGGHPDRADGGRSCRRQGWMAGHPGRPSNDASLKLHHIYQGEQMRQG